MKLNTRITAITLVIITTSMLLLWCITIPARAKRIDEGTLPMEEVKYVVTIEAPFDLNLEHEENVEAREQAVSTLEDWTLLAHIAKNDKSAKVRRRAVWRLSETWKFDMEAGITIVEGKGRRIDETKMQVRRPEAEILEAQKILSEIVKNDADYGVRQTAVRGIEDQAIIADVAKNDESWLVRHQATERLDDQTILEYLAKNDPHCSVRNVATSRLNDQNLLVEITKNDEDEYVRRRAEGRLNELKK